MRSALSLLCTSLLAMGCGSEAEETGALASSCGGVLAEGRAAIVGGKLDDRDPAVVAVNTLDVACLRAGAPLCTGTLIAPDVVLTAAHCVGERAAEGFGVLFGKDADAGEGPLGAGLEGSFYRVVAIRISPDFDPGSLTSDIALLRLEAPSSTAVIPLAGKVADSAAPGAPARIVGFGKAGSEPGNQKREGSVRVRELRPLEIVYDRDTAITCEGDSGGPLLMTMDGVEELVGVTSRGDAGCSDYGVATRVDMLSSLLNEAW